MYDWNKNLLFAEDILNGDRLVDVSEEITEAYYRATISRAYYACFNLICELNDKLGCTPPKRSDGTRSHEDQIYAMRSYLTKKDLLAIETNLATINKYIQQIEELKGYRIKADYKKIISPKIDEAYALRVYKKAKYIINFLNQLAGN